MRANLTHLSHRLLAPGDTLAAEFDAIIPPEIFDPLLGWRPTSLASCAFWFDFTDGAKLFQDAAGTVPAGIGDPIGCCKNKGTVLANSATQSGADTTKPTREATAAYFDGGDELVWSSTGAGAPPATWGFSFKVASHVNGVSLFRLNGTSARFAMISSGTALAWQSNQAAGNVTSGIVSTVARDAFYIARSLSDCDLYCDRVLRSTFDPADTISHTSPSVPTTSTTYAEIRIKHIFGFAAALSGADLAALIAWLSREALA